MRRVAVILAGAVAKGAFEAGALQVLAETDAQVVRIVATSSGALNAVTYASAVRGRRERAGAAALVQLWRDKATWGDIVHLDWKALLHREAVSDLAKVRDVLRANVRPVSTPDPAAINLRLVLAALDGQDATIGNEPATTYEALVEFDGPSFDDATKLDEVFTAALASSSLPLVFAPTMVPGVGRCIDGGAVNNTPVGYALEGALGQTVDCVVVIAATVERLTVPLGEQHGLEYIGHLIDMLINERLYRDLHEAESRNQALLRLDALGVGDDVRRALGWEGVRAVPIVQIRPLDPLSGSAFSAFGDAAQRDEYITTGIARANDVLGKLGWLPQLAK